MDIPSVVLQQSPYIAPRLQLFFWAAFGLVLGGAAFPFFFPTRNPAFFRLWWAWLPLTCVWAFWLINIVRTQAGILAGRDLCCTLRKGCVTGSGEVSVEVELRDKSRTSIAWDAVGLAFDEPSPSHEAGPLPIAHKKVLRTRERVVAAALRARMRASPEDCRRILVRVWFRKRGARLKCDFLVWPQAEMTASKVAAHKEERKHAWAEPAVRPFGIRELRRADDSRICNAVPVKISYLKACLLNMPALLVFLTFCPFPFSILTCAMLLS